MFRRADVADPATVASGRHVISHTGNLLRNSLRADLMPGFRQARQDEAATQLDFSPEAGPRNGAIRSRRAGFEGYLQVRLFISAWGMSGSPHRV